EPEVAPCDRTLGSQGERPSIRGDRFVIAPGGRESESQVIVEFGLIGHCGCSGMEQRERFIQTLALVQHDAEIVRRCRMARGERKGRTVPALCRFEVAALVHRDRATYDTVG